MWFPLQTSAISLIVHSSPIQHVYDQKNIRRRVYDALNVLMAMNIISKEKKEIKWIGLPTNSAQECQNLEVHPEKTQTSDLKYNLPLPCWVLYFSSFLILTFVSPIGGETKAVGENQAETVTATRTHIAGMPKTNSPQV